MRARSPRRRAHWPPSLAPWRQAVPRSARGPFHPRSLAQTERRRVPSSRRSLTRAPPGPHVAVQRRPAAGDGPPPSAAAASSAHDPRWRAGYPLSTGGFGIWFRWNASCPDDPRRHWVRGPARPPAPFPRPTSDNDSKGARDHPRERDMIERRVRKTTTPPTPVDPADPAQAATADGSVISGPPGPRRAAPRADDLRPDEGQGGAPPAPPPPAVVVAEVVKKTVPIIGGVRGADRRGPDGGASRAHPGRARARPLRGRRGRQGGPVLFEIQRTQYEASLQSARAQLAKAQAELARAQEQSRSTGLARRARAAQGRSREGQARRRPAQAPRPGEGRAAGRPGQRPRGGAGGRRRRGRGGGRPQGHRAHPADRHPAGPGRRRGGSRRRHAGPAGSLLHDASGRRSAGIIGRLDVDEGNLVGRGEPTLLATMSTVDPIKVSTTVSEADYLRFARRAAGPLGRRRASAARAGPGRRHESTRTRVG